MIIAPWKLKEIYSFARGEKVEEKEFEEMKSFGQWLLTLRCLKYELDYFKMIIELTYNDCWSDSKHFLD